MDKLPRTWIELRDGTLFIPQEALLLPTEPGVTDALNYITETELALSVTRTGQDTLVSVIGGYISSAGLDELRNFFCPKGITVKTKQGYIIYDRKEARQEPIPDKRNIA